MSFMVMKNFCMLYIAKFWRGKTLAVMKTMDRPKGVYKCASLPCTFDRMQSTMLLYFSNRFLVVGFD